MCKFCDGQIRKGQNVFVYFSDLALGWTLELKDFERSMMVSINYCPFCGRELKEADAGHVEIIIDQQRPPCGDFKQVGHYYVPVPKEPAEIFTIKR